MQATGLLCCPQWYACLSNGMACLNMVLAMPLGILGRVYLIWPQMLVNLCLSLLSGLSLQWMARKRSHSKQSTSFKIYCEEETSCVLEEPVSLRALTGLCANSTDMDTSTIDISTEPPFELMTPSELTKAKNSGLWRDVLTLLCLRAPPLRLPLWRAIGTGIFYGLPNIIINVLRHAC